MKQSQSAKDIEYTMELAQDLKAIHGLDAETELANILSAEILAEINREVVRTIYVTAKKGAANDTITAGIFDMDVDSNEPVGALKSSKDLCSKLKEMQTQLQSKLVEEKVT